MRQETATATDPGTINPTTITTDGDLLNLQETQPVTITTMSAPAGQSVTSTAVSPPALFASRHSPQWGDM